MRHVGSEIESFVETHAFKLCVIVLTILQYRVLCTGGMRPREGYAYYTIGQGAFLRVWYLQVYVREGAGAGGGERKRRSKSAWIR